MGKSPEFPGRSGRGKLDLTDIKAKISDCKILEGIA